MGLVVYVVGWGSNARLAGALLEATGKCLPQGSGTAMVEEADEESCDS